MREVYKPSVLILEDEPENYEAQKRMLQKNFLVTVITNYQEAIASVVTGAEFDYFICDGVVFETPSCKDPCAEQGARFMHHLVSQLGVSVNRILCSSAHKETQDYADDTGIERTTLNHKGGYKGGIKKIMLDRLPLTALHTFDINYLNPTGPERMLSNLTPRPFTLDEINYASLEGFLQALKFQNQRDQIRIAQLTSHEAWKRGQSQNGKWKKAQTLWWKGRSIDRHSTDYQELLNHAFGACFVQNQDFRKWLWQTRNDILSHSIGNTNPADTVLTRHEYISRLEWLRSQLRPNMAPLDPNQTRYWQIRESLGEVPANNPDQTAPLASSA